MYFTGVGGFANLSEGGNGSYYQGPANALLGPLTGFSASCLFMTDAQALSADGDALFDASTGAGPIAAGWRMFVNSNAGAELSFGVTLANGAAGTSALATSDLGEAIPSRPLFISTFTYDPNGGATNDGQIALHVNAATFVTADFAEGEAYVPAAGGSQAAIGNQNAAPTAAASGCFVLGCGFSASILTLEQVYRHQLACLEAGDFVDGAQGGAFGAGLPTFDNLYSARRSNAGVGETTFVAGVKNGVTVGQVPRAAATWVDLNGNPARNFTRIDDGSNPACFTAGFKRVG